MKPEQQLLKFFEPLAMNQNAKLDPIIALEYKDSFIKKCEELDLAIIGIECFKKEKDKFIPQLDLIADFSDIPKDNWGSYKHQSYTACKKFFESISQYKPDTFSFVVLEKNEF